MKKALSLITLVIVVLALLGLFLANTEFGKEMAGAGRQVCALAARNDVKKYGHCVKKIAEQLGAADLCASIPAEEGATENPIQAECYTSVAVELNDEGICQNLEPHKPTLRRVTFAKDRQDCAEAVARENSQ